MTEYGKVLEKIKEDFSDSVIDSWESREELNIVVKEDAFYNMAEYIQKTPDLNFDFMANMTIVDYLESDPPYGTRFVGVYHFYSMCFGYRVRIKVPIANSGEKLPSLTSLWKCADFFEREAFDMFGISFQNHPDMRRLFMPEDWKGHPLRKDYPIMGFGEEE